jgi:ribonuclease HI
MRQVELWCDGSGTIEGTPGGWAYVLRMRKSDGSWVAKEGSGCASATTSQRMEIIAFVMGLRALKQPCQVQVYGDSQYVMYAVSKHWIQKWEAKRWHKVKNDDLWREAIKLLKVHAVTTHWIKGHIGVDLNEQCDVAAGAQRKIAAAASDLFFAEPVGERSAVQPALLDPDASSHLEAISVGG